AFGVNVILNDINFHIEVGEKLGVVGVNGAGKSTLMKIITGEQQADTGQVIIPAGKTMGFMSQLMSVDPENTIEQELLTVFSDLISIEDQMTALTLEMSTLSGEKLNECMERYSKLSFSFEQQNGYEYKSRVRGVITGLDFLGDEKKLVGILSGGQKTRLSLGKLLLSSPDILLLDEPTNHLDINSINWLEEFLKAYQKSVIIVSHDRYFLDRIVSRIFEIENTHGTMYYGNYSYYAGQKEIVRQNQLKRYIEQQRVIKKQEESIRLLKSFNREKQVRRAESKQKQLDKLEKLNRPESLPDKIHIELAPKIKSGNDVLFVKNLAMAFGENFLFDNVSFDIKRGEKVALLGPNGVGKTTLFNIILGKLTPLSGEVIFGHNVIPAIYDQGQQSLNDEKNIVEEINDAYPHLTIGEIRNVLAAFVFTGDDVFKKINTLSGGERGRVSLAKIMLKPANFLLLDEPTNHLDMFSKEILEEALLGYTGTLIFISHDRYFINAVADRIIELTCHGANIYNGNYDYYMEKLTSIEEGVVLNNLNTSDESKSDWSKKKETESQIRKQKNRYKKLIDDIKKLEEIIEELDTKLNDPYNAPDHELLTELFEKKTEDEVRLLEMYEELEGFDNAQGE
ncbi:MAG: ABC-F family ATP-binding cassette domain-containing protein, partial [Clostridiales bacterium]|nr:ABC-F family ATP-binding cassette domain-containing protein [Clostridiales bacterium]